MVNQKDIVDYEANRDVRLINCGFGTNYAMVPGPSEYRLKLKNGTVIDTKNGDTVEFVDEVQLYE